MIVALVLTALAAEAASVSPPLGAAPAVDAAKQQLETVKLAEEIKKLRLETEKLAEERASWLQGPWVSLLPAPLVALLGVAASALVAWVTARRARFGAFDVVVLEQRLTCYRRLVAATEIMALYFPSVGVSPTSCREAGESLRATYFTGAGILLSRESRDQYFLFVRALTRAAAAERLAVPRTTADYRSWISEPSLNMYRSDLKLNDPTRAIIDDWEFGVAAPDDATPSRRFRDFVLLQKLASSLRTALSNDIRGRRRPEE